MIPKEEIPVIRECYRRSVHPRHLAHYYNVPLHEITDILGLPRDKKKMERLHREKNFFDHGVDNNLEKRIESYGMFLHEGDFEKYMPYCFMRHFDPRFILAKWKAKRIPKSNSLAEEARRVWVLMRFAPYQEAEWSKLNDEFVRLHGKLNAFIQ